MNRCVTCKHLWQKKKWDGASLRRLDDYAYCTKLGAESYPADLPAAPVGDMGGSAAPYAFVVFRPEEFGCALWEGTPCG